MSDLFLVSVSDFYALAVFSLHVVLACIGSDGLPHVRSSLGSMDQVHRLQPGSIPLSRGEAMQVYRVTLTLVSVH